MAQGHCINVKEFRVLIFNFDEEMSVLEVMS
jgi:hypothetical protein